jgi:hypothetical protein
LATAEGLSADQFLAEVESVAREAATSPVLVVAGGAGEAADLLASLPVELAGRALAVAIDALPERLPALSLVVTAFPALARLRAALAARGLDVPIVPAETQLTEETVRALAELPPDGRIALVTLEKENWDHEANDVMKIIGRSRWLKMVLLEGGQRGVAERLEPVEVILHVPRAREATAPFGAGRRVVELRRQLTPRTRDRLVEATGGPA